MISQYLVDEVGIGRIPETLSDLIQKMADSLDRVTEADRRIGE